MKAQFASHHQDFSNAGYQGFYFGVAPDYVLGRPQRCRG